MRTHDGLTGMTNTTALLAGLGKKALVAGLGFGLSGMLAGPALAQGMDDGMMSESFREGWYVGAGGGWHTGNEVDLDAAVGVADAEAEREDSWLGLGKLGYAFPEGIRVEFESAYRAADVDSFTRSGVTGPGTGDFTVWSNMANIYRYFDIGHGRVQPYVGVGGGHASIEAGTIGFTGAGNLTSETVDRFAYQGILGLAFPFFHDRLEGSIDYRYFEVVDADASLSGALADYDYDSHDLVFSLTFHFPAPKPMPMPEPAPMPVAEPAPPMPEPEPMPDLPNNYLVFFDFDESNLTPLAQQVLDAAANDIRRGNVVRLEVVGHADRSGPASYNEALSERRAEAVRRGLVARGVSAGIIDTAARGESDPLVATQDGVREPQNRRVEIILPQ